MWRSPQALLWRFLPALVLLAAFCLIYLPDAGRGFVKDDFNWIARSRLSSPADLTALFGSPSGFFRPMVSLSFAANWKACGLKPFCFGLTNLLLAIACAAAVATLARQLSLPFGAAILASALWMFNWNGINMATLWISGRTALLLVLFSASAAAAYVQGRWWLAAILTFGAMLSKEEAVLLPVILVAWSTIDRAMRVRSRPGIAGQGRDRNDVSFICASFVIEAIYFLLRARSGALTPRTAPWFYRFEFSASRLLTNAPEYLDRSVTFSALALTLFWLLCRPRSLTIDASFRSRLTFGLVWWLGALAITIFLPIRSSLYACFPAVGPALVVAAVVAAAWRSAPPRRRLRAGVAGLAAPFLLWPLYHARNQRYTREAELSTLTLTRLTRIARTHPPGTAVLLEDDPSARPSLDAAFGPLIEEAVRLCVSPELEVRMEPPPASAYAARPAPKPPSDADVILTLRRGSLLDK